MASINYLQTSFNAADQSTYTFSSQSFGTAASDRYVIVNVGARKSGTAATISSATIGGVAATIIVNNNATATNTGFAGILIALVPSGTSGTVVVNFTGTMVRCTISVYSATGINPSPNSTLSVDGPTLSGSLSVTNGSISVGCSSSSLDNAYTWTGLNEDYDLNPTGESTYRWTSASIQETSATTKTVSVTATGLTNESTMAVANFAPSTSAQSGSMFILLMV